MNTALDVKPETIAATLSDLIAIDTTNPPGNETVAAEYVRGRLAAAGVPATVLESAPGRGSVVARLAGDGSARPLLLMSHLDVVAAEAAQWSRPPFSPAVIDGVVWGRGALDMKGLTAIELELFLALKRLDVPLRRDVILAATADEEAGGFQGMGWLVEHHPELVDAEYAINEGGGFGEQVGDRWLYGVQSAEKGICWLRLHAHGRPGHASMPYGESAVGRLVAAVDRLARTPLPRHAVRTATNYIQMLGLALPAPQSRAVLDLLDPETEARGFAALQGTPLAPRLNACLRNTVAPTMLRAGSKINVIPSQAEADVDCRILPGQTPEAAIAEVQAVVGPDIEIEVLRASAGVESDPESPLFTTIREVIGELGPGSMTAPELLPASTDGRYLAARGVKVYGFWPMKQMPDEPNLFSMIHGHDERISVANLGFGARVLWEIVGRTV